MTISVNGTAGNDLIDERGKSADFKITAGSGNDVVYGGTGNDQIDGGSDNDRLDGGGGSDTLTGGSGNDTLVFRLSENSGSHDFYDGGSGTADRLELQFTYAEWLAVSSDVYAAAPAFKAPGGSAFQFHAFDLSGKNIEYLDVVVGGVSLDAKDDPVTARADLLTTDEDHSSSVNLLANDTAPDLVKSVEILSGPANGTVLSTNLTDPNSQTAVLTYDPGSAYQYLAAGQSAQETVTYRITDADGDVSTATVKITITGADDGPRIPSFSAHNIDGDPFNGSVTVGDFNGDGKLDLIAASPWYGTSSTYLYLGNGDGSFAKAATPIFTEAGLVKVNSADLNGDGKLDLITSNPGADTISVALGDGAGQFGPVSTYAAPGGTLYVSFGDIDHDGDVDMVSGWGSQVLLYTNDGSGSFANAQSVFQSSSLVNEALLVDVSGDGNVDLLFYDGATQQLHTRLGGGDGSFASSDVVLNTDFGTYPRMETGDVNGDGRIDAVLSKGDSFVVCLGQGDGSFVVQNAEYPLGVVLGGNDFYLRDINGDGFLDIAGAGNQVEVLYGKGDGTFLPSTQYSAGIAAGSPGMGFGDLNGDGLVDIVTANEGTGNLSIYLQTADQLI